MFESTSGDFDIQKKHINNKGDIVVTAGQTNSGILGRTDIETRIFSPNTFTIDMFGNAYFRPFFYKMVTHARVFSLKPLINITQRQGLFIASSLGFLKSLFDYGNMCTWDKIKDLNLQLPQTKSNSIDFAFMEDFVHDVEKSRLSDLERRSQQEINAYLYATGLATHTLAPSEKDTLKKLSGLCWQSFNVQELFGESTRGKRLKGADRNPGSLPFVTAGEVNTGISAFIGNKVRIFQRNTTTIDMFGSAKYRKYEYGADDHVAVVHTEHLPPLAAIFVAAACHKVAHTGEFNYGHNFYAKDADELNIMLPAKNGVPDIKTMEAIIRATQKLVINDVVTSSNRRLTAMGKIVNR